MLLIGRHGVSRMAGERGRGLWGVVGGRIRVMHWLAETDRTAAQWYLGVSLILVIGAIAIVLIVALAVGRRWARRQHQSIERDRQARRAAQSAERIDAWRAGSQRYVDQDKLPDEGPDDTDPDDAGPNAPDNPNAPGGWDPDAPPFSDGPAGYDPRRDDEPLFQDDQDDRDPYGLFKDKPYQEPDDDEDFDDDEDWGDDEQADEGFDDDDPDDDPRR